MTIDKRINYEDRVSHRKGGPTNKPNGLTTWSLDDWLEGSDPGGGATEEDKPKKIVFKYGATSQSEEDLVDRHMDDWINGISKGDLDPSLSFMKYLDMILGRQGVNKGGIVSILKL